VRHLVHFLLQIGFFFFGDSHFVYLFLLILILLLIARSTMELSRLLNCLRDTAARQCGLHHHQLAHIFRRE
jgi:hypothetical protein